MSMIPIDTQLRAHGLRKAKPGEPSLPVAVHFDGQTHLIDTVCLPPGNDPVVVETLRAFADQLRGSCPDLPVSHIRMRLVSYSEKIGATDSEVAEASAHLLTPGP